MSLLAPRRFNQQPQQTAQIDAGNQLTKALALVINPGDRGALYEPVQKRKIGTGGGSLTNGATSSGWAYRNTLASAGAYLTGNTALVTSDGAFTGDFTISVLANPASTGTPNIVYGPMGGAAPESYFQFNGTLGSAGAAGRASFITPGGTGVEALGVLDGKFHLFTAVRRAGSALEMWVDGVLMATSTFSGAIATAARSDTLFGYFSGGYGCTFDTALLTVHNRALDPSEIVRLARNPWQIFKAPTRRLWGVSAAVAPTGALVSTLSGANMAASGLAVNPGTFASALAGCTMAAAGSVGAAPSGAFASTLAGATMASSGSIVIPGGFASTLAGATMASAGTVDNRGAMASSLAGASMSASGIVAPNATGTFASTLDGASMSAYGYNGIPPVLAGNYQRLPKNPRHVLRLP